MSEGRKRLLKELIRQLHAGVSPEEVKEKFKQVLKDISPLEISRIEQELIEEGMPREEIQRLCDVHLAVFREQLERQKPPVASENPVGILMEEHKILLGLLENLLKIVNKVQETGEPRLAAEEIKHLRHLVEDLLDAEKHYLREENVLFPLLEKAWGKRASGDNVEGTR